MNICTEEAVEAAWSVLYSQGMKAAINAAIAEMIEQGMAHTETRGVQYTNEKFRSQVRTSQVIVIKVQAND